MCKNFALSLFRAKGDEIFLHQKYAAPKVLFLLFVVFSYHFIDLARVTSRRARYTTYSVLLNIQTLDIVYWLLHINYLFDSMHMA